MWRSRSWRRPAIMLAAAGVVAMALSVAGCSAPSGSPSRTSATRTPTIAAATAAPRTVSPVASGSSVASSPSLNGLDYGPDAVSFVSATQGWAVGDLGCAGCAQVFRTADGGQRWTSVARPKLPGPAEGLLEGLVDLYFANSEDGYIFTGYECPRGCVIMTRNGGRSWQPTTLPPVAQLIAGGDRVYALSQSTSPVLLRSTIGADSWTSLRLPAGASSTSLYIAAEGPTVALLRRSAMGSYPTRAQLGRLWVSTDSGDSWTARPNPCTVADGGAALVSVALDHPNALLVDCYDGEQSSQEQHTQHHLYGSGDTGRSWVRLADPSDTGAPELMADNGAEHAVFVSASGFGFEVHVTLDAAAHWHTVITGGSDGYGAADLRFVSADVGFVLGPSHYAPEHLYRTEDAGRTWQQLPLPGTPPQPAPCDADALRIHGGRQGAQGTAWGEVVFSNVGVAACTLNGIPRISLLRVNGTDLPVEQRTDTDAALHARTLSSRGGSASLTLLWSNWCGPRPGPLNIALRLPGSDGTVQGPFDGPPDYDLVPPCLGARQPSFVQVTDAYS